MEPMRILLVTDYCAKGSLYDIIENEDIKLDNLFIASLINDLIKVRTLSSHKRFFKTSVKISGHVVHSLISISFSWKSQVIKLCHNLSMDASNNGLWSARFKAFGRKLRISWRASTLSK